MLIYTLADGSICPFDRGLYFAFAFPRLHSKELLLCNDELLLVSFTEGTTESFAPEGG